MIKDVLKRQTTIIAVAVIGICLCLMGVSYAVFFDIKNGNAQTVTSGTLTVQFAETKNSLVTNGVTSSGEGTETPKPDADGEKSEGYQFSVTNTGTLPMNYDIYLYDDPAASSAGTPLDHQYIKVKLDSEATKLLSADCENKTRAELGESGSGDISVCKINTSSFNLTAKGGNNTTRAHTVRIWLAENTPEDSAGQIVALKLVVLGEAGEADTSGGGN